VKRFQQRNKIISWNSTRISRKIIDCYIH
jgi:hypothetical protein